MYYKVGTHVSFEHIDFSRPKADLGVYEPGTKVVFIKMITNFDKLKITKNPLASKTLQTA